MANIAHYVGKKFTGTITPDTLKWRKNTLEWEQKSAAHYERKAKRVDFVIVPTGTIPADTL